MIKKTSTIGNSFIGGIKESKSLSSMEFVVFRTIILTLFTINFAIRPLISKAKIKATKMKPNSPRLKPNTPFMKTDLICINKFSNMIILCSLDFRLKKKPHKAAF